MKTLFIQPKPEMVFNNPPLGLGYLAANLIKHGYEADIFDVTFSTYEKLFKKIEEYKPDLVCVSLLTRVIKDINKIMKVVKKINPQAKVIVGDAHATMHPENTFEICDADIIVIKEGEETIIELVKALEKGNDFENIAGIYYKAGDGTIKKTADREPPQDLDSIPFPARHLLPILEYSKTALGRTSWTVPHPATTIIASRGCPAPCSFCAAPILSGRNIRVRSPENVIEEIEVLKSDFGIKGLWFNDDTWGGNKVWAKELLRQMIDKKVNIKWSCNTRVVAVDQEMLNLMKQAGCKLVSYGVESGSQRVLNKLLIKGITKEKVREAFQMTEKAGIFSQASFMVGIPGETLDEMQETIDFAKEVCPDSILVNITAPLPGLKIEEFAKQYGIMDEDAMEKMDFMSMPVIKTKEFTPEQVMKMQHKFIKSFYFNPRYIYKQIRRIRSKEDFLMRYHGFLQLIGAHRLQLFGKGQETGILEVASNEN